MMKKYNTYKEIASTVIVLSNYSTTQLQYSHCFVFFKFVTKSRQHREVQIIRFALVRKILNAPPTELSIIKRQPQNL